MIKRELHSVIESKLFQNKAIIRANSGIWNINKNSVTLQNVFNLEIVKNLFL